MGMGLWSRVILKAGTVKIPQNLAGEWLQAEHSTAELRAQN